MGIFCVGSLSVRFFLSGEQLYTLNAVWAVVLCSFVGPTANVLVSRLASDTPPFGQPLTSQSPQTKHHNTYVTNVNNVLAGENGGSLKGLSLSAIQKEVVSLPDSIKTAVRNSGGGHWNHSFFWSVMGKTGSIAEAPSGDLKSSIESTFGSLDEMQKKFNTAAATRFGSGWAWLSVNADGQLFISSTPNQDNPLMEGIVDQPGTPILGLDVWEHAYYLKYQNRRPEYIASWWKTVDFDVIAKNYTAAKSGGLPAFDTPLA